MNKITHIRNLLLHAHTRQYKKAQIMQQVKLYINKGWLQ